MCGLVGIAGDINHKEKEAFKDMLVFDSVRGIHGTGVACVDYSGNIDWFKRAGHVYDLMEGKHFDTVVSVTKKCIFGHNRYATLGGHTTNNAHPFEFENVIGAHNGTIDSSSRRKLKDYTKYDVDSEALYATIDHYIGQGNPVEDAVAKTLKEIEGAWALTFYDRASDRMCFIRNDDRPLFMAFIEDRKGLIWASESWMIYASCARRGIKIVDKVASLTPNVLYAFKIPKSTSSTFENPTRTKAEGKPKTDYSFMGGHTGTKDTSSKHTPSAPHSVVPYQHQQLKFLNENNNPRHNFKKPYKDAYGKILTKSQFTEQVRLGHSCCYCNDHTPTWGESVCFLRPSPTGQPQYLCKQCIEDPQIMDIVRAMR